jgi:hypothetical protein
LFYHDVSPMGPWEHFQPVAGCIWTLAKFDQHPERLSIQLNTINISSFSECNGYSD